MGTTASTKISITVDVDKFGTPAVIYAETPAARIVEYYGIISTIRKHVVAQQSLAGRNECIRIEETTALGAVITGL